MEFQKIVKFLDTTSDDKDLPRFVTKKWIEVYDQSGGKYNVNKEIRTKTSMLKSDLCDYSDPYIVLKGNINVTKKYLLLIILRHLIIQMQLQMLLMLLMIMRLVKKNLVSKNKTPFINCNSKINCVKIDNTEDLEVVMPMYNLLECSKNYKKTTGSFCKYYRDKPNSDTDDNEMKYSIINSKSFDYKPNFIGSVTHNNLTKMILKLLCHWNIWAILEKLKYAINCEVELILTWFKNCVLIDKLTRDANYGADPIVHKIDNPENATFKITDTKLYVPVVTLSKENDIKLLEQLKTGFKRTIKWKKYRSQITVQRQNKNLNYLIDPTFANVDRLFVLSFSRTNAGDNKGY